MSMLWNVPWDIPWNQRRPTGITHHGMQRGMYSMERWASQWTFELSGGPSHEKARMGCTRETPHETIGI